jgi:hypothetical protein
MSLPPIDPITAALNFGGKILDRVIADPNTREEARIKLAELQQHGDLAVLTTEAGLIQAQIEVNKAEAQNPRLFVSGARPFITWVCGFAFAYHFVVQPLLAFLMAASGHPVALPAFNMETLLTVLFGILGLGGLRSFEKVKGVASR